MMENNDFAKITEGVFEQIHAFKIFSQCSLLCSINKVAKKSVICCGTK